MLKRIKLFRYFVASSGTLFPKWIFSFRDENRKISQAKYKLLHFIGKPTRCIYRLDARSIRYVQRVEIVDATALNAVDVVAVAE